jgi:hypothetical protein
VIFDKLTPTPSVPPPKVHARPLGRIFR